MKRRLKTSSELRGEEILTLRVERQKSVTNFVRAGNYLTVQRASCFSFIPITRNK